MSNNTNVPAKKAAKRAPAAKQIVAKKPDKPIHFDDLPEASNTDVNHWRLQILEHNSNVLFEENARLAKVVKQQSAHISSIYSQMIIFSGLLLVTTFLLKKWSDHSRKLTKGVNQLHGRISHLEHEWYK